MSFKGIWIPEELLELNLSWTKRILIAEISQLEMLEKGCIASNNHFADKLKLSKQAVSKALNELAKEEYILIDNAQTKRNIGRIITINFGKSGINFGKSGVHGSGESKENKTINKTINKLIASFRKSFKSEIKVSDETLLDFIRYRKEIKKEIKTARPITLFINALAECVNAGYKKEDVIELMKNKEWQTLNIDWVKKTLTKNEDNTTWSNHGTDYDNSKEWK